MAFDGLCVAAVVKELNETLTGGRVTKISQPEEKDRVRILLLDVQILLSDRCNCCFTHSSFPGSEAGKLQFQMQLLHSKILLCLPSEYKRIQSSVRQRPGQRR